MTIIGDEVVEWLKFIRNQNWAFRLTNVSDKIIVAFPLENVFINIWLPLGSSCVKAPRCSTVDVCFLRTTRPRVVSISLKPIQSSTKWKVAFLKFVLRQSLHFELHLYSTIQHFVRQNNLLAQSEEQLLVFHPHPRYFYAFLTPTVSAAIVHPWSTYQQIAKTAKIFSNSSMGLFVLTHYLLLRVWWWHDPLTSDPPPVAAAITQAEVPGAVGLLPSSKKLIEMA